MKALLSSVLFVICHCSSLLPSSQVAQEFVKWSKTEYGERVFKSIKQSSLQQDVILQNLEVINQFENALTSNISAEILIFQEKQQTLIGQKHQLKQGLFMLKFKMKALTSETDLNNRSLVLAKDMHLQKQRISEKFSQQMLNSTVVKVDDEIITLKDAQELVSSIMNVFNDVKDQAVRVLQRKDELDSQELSGQQNLDKRKGVLRPFEKDFVGKLHEMCMAAQRFVYLACRKLQQDNPYKVLVRSLIPLLENANAEVLPQVPDILTKILDKIDESLEEAEEMKLETVQYTSERKQLFKQKADLVAEQSKSPDELVQHFKDRELKLADETDEAKELVDKIQKKVDDITEQIDGFGHNYNERYKGDLENLAMLRKLKNVMYTNELEFTKIVRSLEF